MKRSDFIRDILLGAAICLVPKILQPSEPKSDIYQSVHITELSEEQKKEYYVNYPYHINKDIL